MPTPRNTLVVNPPGRAPDGWPDECTNIVVREIFPITPDGWVWRGLSVSWRYSSETHPPSGFRVYARRGDHDVYELCKIAEANAREVQLFGVFRQDVDYRVAVVATSLDCCIWRPPDLSVGTVNFRVYGEELCTDAPTNLVVEDKRDHLHVSWDPPTEAPSNVPRYQVRIGGEYVALNQVFKETTETSVRIFDAAPTGHFGGAFVTEVQVGVLSGQGNLHGVARANNALTWGQATKIEDEIQASASSWTGGTHAGTEANGDNALVLSAGNTVGTFTGTAIDLGTIEERTVLALTYGNRKNVGLTPGVAMFSPNSVEGCKRSPHGSRAEEAFPQQGLERLRGYSPASAPDTPNGSGSMVPNSFATPRPVDEPVLTPNEARFGMTSAAGKSSTPNEGFLSTAGTTFVLEVRYSDDDVTYTAWATYQPVTRTFRYLEYRVCITQPFPSLVVVVVDVGIAFMRLRGDPVWVQEKPTGVIDGANDIFTVADCPVDPAALLLFLDGVAQDPVAGDFTLSGTTITYAVPPTGGSTHFVIYPK